MTYSLFDRIHGAFWGVAIAHQLTQPHRSTMPCLEVIAQGVDLVCQLATGEQSDVLSGGLAIVSEDGMNPDWECLICTILPLLLYDANDRDNLNHHLQVLLTVSSPVSDGDGKSQDASSLDAWQVSQITALAIAHALQPSPLDVSLIDALRLVWPVSQLSSPHPLTHLHTWLTSANSLAMVTHSLSSLTLLSTPIPAVLLALYCSLSNASDPRLALLRASRSSPDPRLTTVLTGAMIGASQGNTAFPTVWKRDRHLDQTLHQLASRLLAIRAGVYVAPGVISPSPWPNVMPILATPGIFHP